jgi:hypothetical protein
VLVHGAWRAPRGLGRLERHAGGALINFVLDTERAGGGGYSAPLVGGVPALTLGHGLAAPGAAHAFYGTGRVVDALRALPGFERGAVEVRRCLRDEQGHAAGFA